MDHLPAAENKVLISIGIGGKPVSAVNLLAVSVENRIFVVLVFGNPFALDFDDLKVLVVNPDAADEEPLLRLFHVRNYPGRDIENIEVQIIYSLFTEVLKVVLVDLRRL